MKASLTTKILNVILNDYTPETNNVSPIRNSFILSKSSEAAIIGPYDHAPDYTTPSQPLVRTDGTSFQPGVVGPVGGPNT